MFKGKVENLGYHRNLLFQGRGISDGTKIVISHNISHGKRAIQTRMPRQKSKRISSQHLSGVPSGHDFDIDKSNIIAEIKKEAQENVLKEKVLATLNLPMSSTGPSTDGDFPGKIRRLPPQQCVILKPVSDSTGSESGINVKDQKDPPPIIIPGNPEKSIQLLKDEKGINFIEKEIEKHYEQKIPTVNNQEDGSPNSKALEKNTAAIILTSLSSLDETTENKSQVKFHKKNSIKK